MSFGIFENLDSGANSLTVTASANRRNLQAQVHQAYKDFGKFLASAESVDDLEDRVRLVEAELVEAGVSDPESVLDGLAALAASDDTADDSDSSEDDSDADPTDHDDSDVPDFVDTDEDDDKERKESKVAAGVDPANTGVPGVVPDDYAMQPGGRQGDPNNSGFAGTPNNAPVNAPNPANPNPGAIPGASTHPVVPRNNAGGAPSIPGIGSPIGVPGVPQQQIDPQQRTYSKVLPIVPRITK